MEFFHKNQKEKLPVRLHPYQVNWLRCIWDCFENQNEIRRDVSSCESGQDINFGEEKGRAIEVYFLNIDPDENRPSKPEQVV